MPPQRCSPPPSPDLSAGRRRSIRTRLLAWYDRQKRELPWRSRPGDGYAQLVAEFMLQQTQVSVVLGYYERFMQRFPKLADLARADQEDVLALWSGLGYYSRARNLHAAARQIMQEHAGRVPENVDALMRLPGVGRYTAGAIASIAFGRPVPALDGNVIRVISRLLLIRERTDSGEAVQHLWRVAQRLVPPSRCGDFNQALMELGALVCSPRSPRCPLCPITRACLARKSGHPAQIPVPRRRTRVEEMAVVAAAIRSRGRLLIMRRPHRGLWGGLWDLPSEPAADGEAIAEARSRLARRLPPGCRLQARPLPPIERRLTHRLVTFHVFPGRLVSTAPPRPRTTLERWLSPAESTQVGLSRAVESLLRAVKWPPAPKMPGRPGRRPDASRLA